MSAELNELADGWVECVIEDVVGKGGIFKDGDWVESKDQDPNGDVRLIQLADIGDGRFLDKSSRFLTRSKARELNCTFLRAGDILVARMPDPLGRCCIFPLDEDGRYVTVVDICAIRFGDSRVNAKFMMYLINSPSIRGKISALQSGSTRKRISRGNLATIPLPLPPLNEQHRIVAKIETLFSELDKGIESLKTAREQLKVYRQAVLKHAFEGKLTAKWREQNKDKLETPQQLLARIQQERQARYQQKLQEWQVAVKMWEENGKKENKPGKPKKLAALKETSENETRNFPQLPVGWTYVRLGLLIEEPTYGTSKKCSYDSGQVGVLRIPNISHGAIDSSNLKFASFEEHEVKALALAKGDLLTIRSNGSVSLVGSCALIAEEDTDFLFAGYLIRLRPNHDLVAPFFLLSVLTSHLLRRQIESAAKSTSGVNNINTGEIQNLIVPLPSMVEQVELLKFLEISTPNIAVAEYEIEVQLKKSEVLRQSILKKAFSGKLVPQDPNDEPASALLARIHSERAGRSPVKTRVKE
ncbi:restriction endonuclease subunit S [Marinobacter sp. ELB17]|uniref:restriction endonuclease subunit S n=1 Tax=Marinobacter sp. ELB17 TaxID=270374 RepID=UPI0000F3B04F|nr:restriction endonuclease subunit S [Marinobacter sp. ELB17]EAZ99065.1 Restriction modification system DNA specificity domain [Marinobacter sp. ELB17]